MATLRNNLFIDATVVKGLGRTLSATMKQEPENPVDTSTLEEYTAQFEPVNLTGTAVRFRVLGSATSDAEVLLEKIITEATLPEEDGQIYNPEGGEFSFTITAEDTDVLGVGIHPIEIVLLDGTSLQVLFHLTEGGTRPSEFNRIQIIQV